MTAIHNAMLINERNGAPSENPANGLNSPPKIVPNANPPNSPPKKPPKPVRGAGAGVVPVRGGFRVALSGVVRLGFPTPGL